METILENKSKNQGNNFKVKTLMEHNINFFANFFSVWWEWKWPLPAYVKVVCSPLLSVSGSRHGVKLKLELAMQLMTSSMSINLVTWLVCISNSNKFCGHRRFWDANILHSIHFHNPRSHNNQKVWQIWNTPNSNSYQKVATAASPNPPNLLCEIA